MEHNPNENEAIGVDGKHWGLNCTTWVVHQDLENYVNEGRKYQCHKNWVCDLCEKRIMKNIIKGTIEPLNEALPEGYEYDYDVGYICETCGDELNALVRTDELDIKEPDMDMYE